MKRAGVGLLLGVAVLGMLSGGWIALRPYVGRPKLTLISGIPDGPQADSFGRGVRLAIEERDFRAGAFRLDHMNVPARFLPTPPLPGVRLPGLCPWSLPLQPPVGGNGSFRNSDPAFREGALAACRARAAGARSAYVIGDTSPPANDYSDSSFLILQNDPGNGFSLAAREGGISIAGQELFPRDDFDYRHLVARVARWKTDVVYIDSPGQGDRTVRDLRAKGYRGRIRLSGRTVGADFFQVAGRAANGVEVTWGLVPAPPEEFDARFRARFGVPADPLAHYAYGHLLDVLRALRGVRDAKDVESAFRTLLDPIVGEGPIGVFVARDGCFELLEAVE